MQVLRCSRASRGKNSLKLCPYIIHAQVDLHDEVIAVYRFVNYLDVTVAQLKDAMQKVEDRANKVANALLWNPSGCQLHATPKTIDHRKHDVLSWDKTILKFSVDFQKP